MDVRRKVPRQKSLLRGRIYFNNRSSTADCLVRDMSTHGARLMFADDLVVPDVVDLYIAQKDQIHRAHVVWRHGNDVGVAFADAEKGADPAPEGDLAARVAQLEHEIELLKRTIKRMKTSSPPGDSEAA